MQIIIKNLGPVTEYTFDAEKDFHFIVGQNNVGKSYAITVVYLVLKNLIALVNFPRHMNLFDDRVLMKKVGAKAKELESTGADSLNMTEVFKDALVEMLQASFVASLADSIKGSFDFDNIENKYAESAFSIEIKAKGFSLILIKEDSGMVISDLSFREKIILKPSKRNMNVKRDSYCLTVYHNNSKPEHALNSFMRLVYSFFMSFIDEGFGRIRGVYFLPASRSGLYQALSAFGQIIAELSQSRAFLRKKIELPSISEPLTDYFLRISEIKVNKKNYEDRYENRIAEKIEREIIHGEVSFDQQTKRIIYSPDNTDLKLDVSLTSSMVSEISPIVSYLRYIITEPEEKLYYWGARRQKNEAKPILFIEEPEAHLHPEIQVRMTEVFSELLSGGVKVVMTSHSNYVFNKINNLVIGKKIDKSQMCACVFRGGVKGSTVTNIKIDEYGMDDENFSDVTDLILEEKIALIESMVANGDAAND